MYAAAVSFVALSGVVVVTLLTRTAESQNAFPAIAARSSLPAATADSKIAFGRGLPNRPGVGLWVMNADGSGQRELTRGVSIVPRPTWSPDGQMMAFVSKRDGRKSDVYVMNIDGSGLQRLTSNPAGTPLPPGHPTASRSPSRATTTAQRPVGHRRHQRRQEQPAPADAQRRERRQSGLVA